MDVGVRVALGAATELPEQRSRSSCREQRPSYRENIALSKVRTGAAMMPRVAPYTLRRHEQDLKKFNNLCGLCVLCGEEFRLDASGQARRYAKLSRPGYMSVFR
jgi:hypothetical protein